MNTSIPFSGGAASVFALTTCTAASMREKNDSTNWALGGAASGIFMGLASKLSESPLSISGRNRMLCRFLLGHSKTFLLILTLCFYNLIEA